MQLSLTLIFQDFVQIPKFARWSGETNKMSNKPIFYQLTKKGQKKSFEEDFFTFFPEEIEIIHLLKIKPMTVNMLKDRINRIKEDEYKRPLGKKPRSYDLFLSKCLILTKLGLIEKK